MRSNRVDSYWAHTVNRIPDPAARKEISTDGGTHKGTVLRELGYARVSTTHLAGPPPRPRCPHRPDLLPRPRWPPRVRQRGHHRHRYPAARPRRLPQHDYSSPSTTKAMGPAIFRHNHTPPLLKPPKLRLPDKSPKRSPPRPDSAQPSTTVTTSPSLTTAFSPESLPLLPTHIDRPWLTLRPTPPIR